MYHTQVIKYKTTTYKSWLKIREEVLRKPLGLELSKDDVLNDKNEVIIGVFNDETLIGGVQLRPLSTTEIKLRQMAIASNFQGKGMGEKLLMAAEIWAKNYKYKSIVLSARKTAVLFYKKSDYRTQGDIFNEVGIPHIKMYKDL